MYPFSINGLTSYISDTTYSQLKQNGYSLSEQDDNSIWLQFIDLSKSSLSQTKIKINKSKAMNKIALLKPEQADIAIQAMDLGAQDYLLLPIDELQLIHVIERLKNMHVGCNSYIAVAPKSKQLLMLAHKASNTPANILLIGDTGTGKEPLARYIHDHSIRAHHPFISVNCAAIPEAMLESILFGHVKGAFTSAINDQAGKFEVANNGTLLLDEIGEMPLGLQAKLLRVIQERELERLGGHKTIPLNVRIIAATNRDLKQAIIDGSFREDLFYRLNVLPLEITPLKDRTEDILPLSEFFMNKYKDLSNDQICSLSHAAQEALLVYHWPGNVRELENVIQRALIMRHGQVLQVSELDINPCPESLPQSTSHTLKLSKKLAEFNYIQQVLQQNLGNRKETASLLGITERALRYKLADMKKNGVNTNFSYEHNGAA